MTRLACLSLPLLFTTCCQSLLHELQPHRLRRLNYFSRAGRPDAGMYSVMDNLDEPVRTTIAQPPANNESSPEESTQP